MASRGPSQKHPRRVEGPLRPRPRGSALLQSEALTGAQETQCDMSPKVVTANTGVVGRAGVGTGPFGRPAEQSEAQQHSPARETSLVNDLENRFGKLQVGKLATNPETVFT